MRLARETSLRLAWVAGLFFLQLRFLDTWEFSSDDGHTLLAAQSFLAHPFWFGPNSSVGIPHLPFVYALWGLLLGASGSLRAMQVCLLLVQALGHVLLIGAGRRLGAISAGYLASALWFASPFFFVSFSQKFWEPAALPLFALLSFHALLAFAERPAPTRMLLSLVAALLAVGAHLNALFLFPAPLLVAWQERRAAPWKSWQLALLALIVAAAFSPILASEKAPEIGRILGVAALAAALALGLGLQRPERLGSALLLLIGALAAYHAVRGGAGNPLQRMADLLSPFRRALPVFLGQRAGPDGWLSAFPEAALVVLFLVRSGGRFVAASLARRALFLALALPLAALGLEGILIREGPPHWSLVVFPLLWLAVADSALWLTALVPGKPLRMALTAAAVAGLLVPRAARSLRLEASVAATGGEGDRLATLGTRLAVLDQISGWPGVPALFEVVVPYRPNWYQDIDGWRFLRSYYLERVLRDRAGKGRFVYLHQENGLTSEPGLVEVLRAAPGVKEERIGSISFFSADHLVDGGGVAVR